MRGIISAANIIASSSIQDFFESYPSPDAAKKVLWELLVAATGSQHADIWDGETRAKMLFFYEQCADFLDAVYDLVNL